MVQFLSAERLLNKTPSLIPHTQKGKAAKKEIVFMPKIFTQKLGRQLRVLKFPLGNKLVTHLCQGKRELNQGTLRFEQPKCLSGCGSLRAERQDGWGEGQRLISEEVKNVSVSLWLRWERGWETGNSRVAPHLCVQREVRDQNNQNGLLHVGFWNPIWEKDGSDGSQT